MESIFLMFSGLKPTTLIKYLTINELPLHPTGAFALTSVSISETDGWRREIVNMEVRLATGFKLFEFNFVHIFLFIFKIIGLYSLKFLGCCSYSNFIFI